LRHTARPCGEVDYETAGQRIELQFQRRVDAGFAQVGYRCSGAGGLYAADGVRTGAGDLATAPFIPS
jgi:hypothetical protein